MLRNHDSYPQTETYSDYDDAYFNQSVGPSHPLDYGYPSPEITKETEISDSELLRLSLEHYLKFYPSNFINHKPSFFLLQSELFLTLRMYRDSLASSLVFEYLTRPNIVSKSIKMICFYQLNYTRNFRILKDEIMTLNLDPLSEPLKKNVVGTIQVATWMPEFMNCLNKMNKNKS